jgi:tripartite-type tricarboxylate transporter receptor subunit TctC
MLAAATAAACVGLGERVAAEAYPSRTIRIIVPAAAGSPIDVTARLAAEILRDKLGQPVVVDHRPGAGGAIGAREVAKAAVDGYTLLAAGTSQLAVVPAFAASAGYDPTRDFTAVAQFMQAFQILVVHPSAPWKSVQDLLDDPRLRGGKLNWAHSGPASLPQLAGELFMARTGAKMIGVPYRGGGESVTAVLGHAVDLTFENVTILLPLIRDGKLRGLAVTSKARSPLAPDLPTMAEGGIPGYEVTTFFGLVAPARTPAEIVLQLNVALNEGLRDQITKLGAVPALGAPEDFAATISTNFEKWRLFGQAANIQID